MIAPHVQVAGGETDLFTLPWRIDAVRPPLLLPPPSLGQHTQEFWQRFVV
jgi:hypothetical protein